MLAQLIDGELDFADVMFLIATILGVVAAFLSVSASPPSRYSSLAGWLAVACLAFGFLLL